MIFPDPVTVGVALLVGLGVGLSLRTKVQRLALRRAASNAAQLHKELDACRQIAASHEVKLIRPPEPKLIRPPEPKEKRVQFWSGLRFQSTAEANLAAIERKMSEWTDGSYEVDVVIYAHPILAWRGALRGAGWAITTDSDDKEWANVARVELARFNGDKAMVMEEILTNLRYMLFTSGKPLDAGPLTIVFRAWKWIRPEIMVPEPAVHTLYVLIEDGEVVPATNEHVERAKARAEVDRMLKAATAKGRET